MARDISERRRIRRGWGSDGEQCVADSPLPVRRVQPCRARHPAHRELRRIRVRQIRRRQAWVQHVDLEQRLVSRRHGGLCVARGGRLCRRPTALDLIAVSKSASFTHCPRHEILRFAQDDDGGLTSTRNVVAYAGRPSLRQGSAPCFDLFMLMRIAGLRARLKVMREAKRPPPGTRVQSVTALTAAPAIQCLAVAEAH